MVNSDPDNSQMLCYRGGQMSQAPDYCFSRSWGSNPSPVKPVTYKIDTCRDLAWRLILPGQEQEQWNDEDQWGTDRTQIPDGTAMQVGPSSRSVASLDLEII